MNKLNQTSISDYIVVLVQIGGRGPLKDNNTIQYILWYVFWTQNPDELLFNPISTFQPYKIDRNNPNFYWTIMSPRQDFKNQFLIMKENPFFKGCTKLHCMDHQFSFFMLLLVFDVGEGFKKRDFYHFGGVNKRILSLLFFV